jgi:hypothetical protein
LGVILPVFLRMIPCIERQGKSPTFQTAKEGTSAKTSPGSIAGRPSQDGINKTFSSAKDRCAPFPSYREAGPAQPVDATPYNQLI